MLADKFGFIPMANLLGRPDNKCPEPETLEPYSDARFLAVAKFIYALSPPLTRTSPTG